MEILIIIGLIVVLLLIFTGGGILGWLLRGLGAIFDMLLEGWNSILGCLFWIIVIFAVLAVIAV